jgi:hypothetical protein
MMMMSNTKEDVTNLECPNCEYVSKFYHLDWHAVVCKGCDEEVTLERYLEWQQMLYEDAMESQAYSNTIWGDAEDDKRGGI